MNLNLGKLDSPLGGLLIVTDEQARVRALEFSSYERKLHRRLRERYAPYELIDTSVPPAIALALTKYFDGDWSALSDVPVAASGSPLQLQVWAALREIPAGSTTSYGELALKLGYDDPRMAIEIGAANAANPIAVVIPCHRVVGKNGDLKGYAWGLARKRWLLEHEQALAPRQDLSADSAPRFPGF